MDWIASLASFGDWGTAGSALAGVAGVVGSGSAVAGAVTAGAGRRDGLVADASTSLATGAMKLGWTGASMVTDKAAAQAWETYKNIDFWNDDLSQIPSDTLWGNDVAAADSKKMSKWNTPILDAAAIAHTALSWCNGFGGPNNGAQLGTAAVNLDLALQHLVQAGQTTGWTGAGETTYSGANDAQQDRVSRIAQIDRDFETALKDQAKQVLDLREKFGYIRTAINIAMPVAHALNMAGPAGQAASVVFQTTTALACLSADASHQGLQHQEALKNRTAFATLAARYEGV